MFAHDGPHSPLPSSTPSPLEYSLKAGVRRLAIWYQLLVIMLIFLSVQYQDLVSFHFPITGMIATYCLKPFDLHWVFSSILSYKVEDPSTAFLSVSIALLSISLYYLLKTRAYYDQRGETFFKSSVQAERGLYLLFLVEILYYHSLLRDITTHWEIVVGVWSFVVPRIILPVAVTGLYRLGRDVAEGVSSHPRWYLFTYVLVHGVSVVFEASDDPHRGTYEIACLVIPTFYGMLLNYYMGSKERAGTFKEASMSAAIVSGLRRTALLLLPYSVCLSATWLFMSIVYVLPAVALMMYLLFFFVWFPAALLSLNTDFLVFISSTMGIAVYYYEETKNFMAPSISGFVVLVICFTAAYSLQIMSKLSSSRIFQVFVILTIGLCLTFATYYKIQPDTVFHEVQENLIKVWKQTLRMSELHRASRVAFAKFAAPSCGLLLFLHCLAHVLRVPNVPSLALLGQRLVLSFVSVGVLIGSFFLSSEVPRFLTTYVVTLPHTVQVAMMVCLIFVWIGIQKENEEALHMFVIKVCGF